MIFWILWDRPRMCQS